MDDNTVKPISDEMMTTAVNLNHKTTTSINDVSTIIAMIVTLITTTMATHHFMIGESQINVIMTIQHHPIMMQTQPRASTNTNTNTSSTPRFPQRYLNNSSNNTNNARINAIENNPNNEVSDTKLDF